MGMATGGGGGAKSDINVTPLVDVCLVLLVIFMVMVPRNVPEVSVRMPPESKLKNKPPPKEIPLVVGMGEEGGLTLNRKNIDKPALGDEIKRQLEFRDKKVVFVDFDNKVRYGDAVEILAIARGSGAEVLAIYKEKGRKVPDTLPRPGT